MNEQSMRWIADINLPQVRINNPDVLPLENLTGDLFLQAHITNRYIVSADIEKIVKKMPSINTNTIAVLFDEQNITIEGLIRNLVNFEFCMQNNTTFKQPGSIYLIDTDRNIFLRERNGSLIEMERWKQPQKLSNAFEQNWANSTLFSS
ncbi:MAG: hypothetical protein FI695_06085 [SAR202 cluster bacterium]|nr:hypothetical protein [Chloroflexota bacterium]MQG51531.1 hypothetical protein [SAR202 cluster bacterium]